MSRGHLIFKTLKNPGNTAHGRLCKRGRTPPPGEQLAINPPRFKKIPQAGLQTPAGSPRAPQNGRDKKRKAFLRSSKQSCLLRGLSW